MFLTSQKFIFAISEMNQRCRTMPVMFFLCSACLAFARATDDDVCPNGQYRLSRRRGILELREKEAETLKREMEKKKLALDECTFRYVLKKMIWIPSFITVSILHELVPFFFFFSSKQHHHHHRSTFG